MINAALPGEPTMSPVRAEPHVAESAIVHFSDPESYADGFGDSRMKLTITAGGSFSARLTRLGLDTVSPLVTLGVYTDNAAAISVYRRLGYHHDRSWVSGPLVP